jgi:sugar phosphate isomerase/epimerase
MTSELEINRRDFIKTSAGLAVVAGLGCGTAGAKKIPVGLQLYSVRKECEKDFVGTVAAVARMGYQGVEFAGYYNYDARDLRKLLDDNGLKCCGTHTQLDTLLGDQFEKTVEYNKILGNQYLIVPWLAEEKRKTVQDWIALAGMFNELADKAQSHGMRVGYHNHTFEYQPLEGQLPWDVFALNTNWNVILQFDSGNAGEGGAETLPFLKKYPGRTVTIHLKEFSKTNKKAILGEGDVPWPEVFKVCETIGGTEWYIIEEEKDVYPPLQCVEMCLQNFRKINKT